MGHVAELRKFGIRATAPMFLPGLGAIVRLHQYPQTAREDARVGLAGPLWGLGASVATLALYYATQLPVIAAIATVGAWINLFNLLPVWQLDGARGFRSLSRPQRWVALAVIAATWVGRARRHRRDLGVHAGRTPRVARHRRRVPMLRKECSEGR